MSGIFKTHHSLSRSAADELDLFVVVATLAVVPSCLTGYVFWQAVAVAVGAVVAAWLVLVVLLFAARPDGSWLEGTARLMPNTFRLVRRLASDRTIPFVTRVPVWLLFVYLVSPIDVVPDFIPVVGYVDDAILIGLVLRRFIRQVGADKLVEHWPGTADELDQLTRLLRIGASS